MYNIQNRYVQNELIKSYYINKMLNYSSLQELFIYLYHAYKFPENLEKRICFFSSTKIINLIAWKINMKTVKIQITYYKNTNNR